MSYFQRIKHSTSIGLAKFALPFITSIGVIVALTACSVSDPQGPQPVFKNTDNTQHLFTLDLLEGDTKEALEKEYDAEVLVWKPEAGFAILGSDLEREFLPQSLELDSNQNSLALPFSALSADGWVNGLDGWQSGNDGWQSGNDGWSSGNDGWQSGGDGWSAGVNAAYLGKNESYWEQIDLFGAHYASSTLGEGVKIAVIDTGIDLSHPMFAQSLAPQSEWRDYVDYDNTPQEVMGGRGSGHGTAVAGIILQVAPKATILPIRVLNQYGFGDMDHVIYAIDHAVNSGATIINLSLGSDRNSSTLNKMMLYAKRKGVVTAAAAGNTGADNTLLFPARMAGWATQKGSIFAVGSVDSNDMISGFSTARAHNILFAPGEAIRTTFPGSRLANVTGTSFAAPILAGSLALAYSELNTASEKQDILSYVTSGLDQERINEKFYYTSGEKWRHGNGVLNVNALVHATKVDNLSFEAASPLKSWNSYKAIISQTFKNKKYTRSGTKIAVLNSGGYIQQRIDGLKPNTTYEVEMLVAFNKYNGTANIDISDFASNTREVNKPIIATVINNLNYVQTTFTTGSNNTYAELKIRNHTGRGNFYIDELRLKALSVKN